VNLAAVTVMGSAFLLGSIPVGALVFRSARGTDIRELGSGSVGASNVFRHGGAWLGAATLLMDMAKGAAAVLLARVVCPDSAVVAEWSALASVAGHIFSPWLRFRGGKGAATAAGANMILHPAAVMVALAVFCASAFGSRYASLGTVLAVAVFAAGVAVSGADAHSVVIAIVTAALILWAHRGNMRRLLRGEEPTLKPPDETW